MYTLYLPQHAHSMHKRKQIALPAKLRFTVTFLAAITSNNKNANYQLVSNTYTYKPIKYTYQ